MRAALVIYRGVLRSSSLYRAARLSRTRHTSERRATPTIVTLQVPRVLCVLGIPRRL